MAIHSPTDDFERIFLEHLPFIKRAAEHACRRCHLGPEDTKDFISTVQVKLIDNDYEVLRKFTGKGGCKLSSFLAIVINKAVLDYLNHLWGKWRSSAKATSLGKVAVQLERLLRDGYTFDEACEILRTNHHVDMTWQQLAELAARLSPRSPRRTEGEGALAEILDPGEGADERILGNEREASRQRALDALKRAQATLSPEDRTILKLWSEEISVATIARSLRLEQKPLYRRIERLRKTLREILERDGIDPEDL
jgi:RNA polymerase sigma factor (sigma-70 family)